MTQVRAVTKYIRVNPRKARLAAGLIRGLNVAQASMQLECANTKAGRLLKKTLDSAVANAENNESLRRENLAVKEVRIDEGPRLKRAKPKNKGGTHPVMHRTSHFTVVVG